MNVRETIARALYREMYAPYGRGQDPDAPSMCDPNGCNPSLHEFHSKIPNWEAECGDKADAVLSALARDGVAFCYAEHHPMCGARRGTPCDCYQGSVSDGQRSADDAAP